jgi:hypothetical protein
MTMTYFSRGATGVSLLEPLPGAHHLLASLQATYIRNSIIQAVRQTRKESAGRISQGFVYANPSVASLAAQLLVIVEATSGAGGDEDAPKIKELAAMISEFSVDFPKHRPSMSPRPSSGEVVLLTGSTGGLGTQLLSHLVSLPDVSRIYALNRPSGDGLKSLRDRQVEALIERGLDVGIIDSPKVTLVEGDTAANGLGLDPTLLGEVSLSTRRLTNFLTLG